MKLKPIKVTLLNQYIKKYLNSNSVLNNLRVEGEISNMRESKTGITYFTLCDEKSCVNCVSFDGEYNCINGDKVIVDGEISIYEARGTYQINVKSIETVGVGDMLRELELLKEKLKSIGLFDNNKQVPLYPEKIGVITSKTGAAVKDIIKTFESIKGSFEVVVYNTLVQGDKSKDSIIEGIRYFNQIDKADVILISRGGGSSEDLSVFNNINIAEEIFVSKVPVVTGVGHETDRTLVDYVADVSCHTPTAAAEYIMRGYKDITVQTEKLKQTMYAYVHSAMRIKSAELRTQRYVLKSYLPVESIYKQKNQLDSYIHFIKEQRDKKIKKLSFELGILNERILNNNYKKQLDKGYSIVLDKDNNVIRNIDQVKDKDMLNIIFKNFTVTAEAVSVKENMNL